MVLTVKPSSASLAIRQRQRLIVLEIVWLLLLGFVVVPVAARGIFFTRSRQHPRPTSSTSATRDDRKQHANAGGVGGGRACSIYVWDFTSALLSRWCHHLQRDCVYEGRGGHKFVRIEPGSMLQLLYPCSRYSPDRCWLCGGNFRDHLTLWWSKHLYTPFDLYVEQVHRDGVANGSSTTVSSTSATSASQKKQQKLQKQLNQLNQPPAAEYAFHRRYVVDLPNLWVRGAKNGPRDADKMIQRHVSQRFPLIQENPNRIEIRSHSSDPNHGAQYAVPAIDKQRLGTPRHAMVLMTVRELFLTAVESLMDLEQLDQTRLEQRQQQQQ